MSRIFRSRDLSDEKVSALPIDQNRMHDPRLKRPTGGIQGLGPGAQTGAAALSTFEKRQREARDLLDQARAQAEKIQQEAYHKGFEQGEQAGMKLASQKVESVLRELQNLINGLQHERERLIREHESQLIRIAFAIAIRIVHREIEQENDVVLGVVRDALKKVVKADRVRVHVSPYDLDLLRQQMSESGIGDDFLSPQIELEGDFEITRGGCRIETGSGEIDATIQTQIELLKSILWHE